MSAGSSRASGPVGSRSAGSPLADRGSSIPDPGFTATAIIAAAVLATFACCGPK